MMIGQLRLINEFKNKTLDTLNHSNLIIAPKGYGKHTFVKELATIFRTELLDLTDFIDLDTIQQLESSATVKFYLIDLDKISIKEQNMILKLVEEPLNTVFLFLIASSETIPLSTIYNRCILFKFEQYSIAELKAFTDDPMLIKLFDNPGLIEKAKTQDINKLIALVDNFIENAKKANYANLLTITNKINFSNDNSLFDIDIFMTVLLDRILDKLLIVDAYELIKLFALVKFYIQKLNLPNINKRYIFEKFLLDAKEL